MLSIHTTFISHLRYILSEVATVAVSYHCRRTAYKSAKAPRTLSATSGDGDSTAGADTIRVQYTSTSTGTDATMEYSATVIS